MATITEELRVAIREFKSRINSFNFVINHEEPPFPIHSIDSYKAQLDLANEYLEKHPEFNSEDFNTIGLPLFVKETIARKIKYHQLPERHQEHTSVNELLWEAYMTLEHGDHDERLGILDKLKNHFERVGKPTMRS